MTQYLRFFLMVPVVLLTTAGIIAGGPWMWTGLSTCVIGVLLGDAVLKDDISVPHYGRPLVLKALLYSMLPLVVVMLYALAWMVTPGDPLHVASRLGGEFASGLLQAKEQTSWFDLIGGVLSATLIVGIATTNVAHELMHSPDRFARTMSRMLLTFSYDWPLIVSHLYGHHLTVGTDKDHTTSRRGESVYAFILRSTFGGHMHALGVEAKRLQNMRRSRWSWRNSSLSGYVVCAAVTVAYGVLTGWQGALVFAVCAVLGKSLLEIVNYVQHYGLLRVEGTPIAERHSWSSNKPISSYLLCNMTRHAHHHLEGELPFWKLQPAADGPEHVHGYMALILIALVPPLWHRHMAPRLLQWDRDWATAAERGLAQRANVLSGVHQLRTAAACDA